MGIYSYLKKQEKDAIPYTPNKWQACCFWLLHNIYGARYWKEVALAQNKQHEQQRAVWKREAKHYHNRLGVALKLYATHIGEPAYSLTWHQLNIEELPESTAPEPKHRIWELADAEFRKLCEAQEV